MAHARDITTRLRRGYLRHRRLVTAGCAAVAVVSVIHVVAPASPSRAPLVVTARDLADGRVVEPDDVRVVEVDPDIIPSAAATSVSAVIGRVVAGPMRRGEPLTDRRLVGGSLVAGYPGDVVAVPVRIHDADVVSLLRVGDRIDIYSATGDQAAPARRVAADAPVVSLPALDGSGNPGALVVIAVAQRAAARLAQAEATTSLSVSLRR